jgi:hypothetical protein
MGQAQLKITKAIRKGPMPLSGADIIDVAFGDRLPYHRATTFHLAALHPFFIESGLIDPRTGFKVSGLPYGYCGRERSGGIYYYDEYLLYQTGILHNANVKVFGKIDHRKSSLIKFVIYMGVYFGYNHLVIDPKGEYTALVDLLNLEFPGSAKVLRFGQDTTISINLLDNSMSWKVQRDLLASVIVTTMGGDRSKNSLDVVDKELLWEAVKDAHKDREEPTLPVVVEKLFNPTPEMADGMRQPIQFLKEKGYRLALSLRRLTEGDLVGMFDKPTTPGLFKETPLLVMNCEGVSGEAAVIMILLIGFFTQSQWAKENPGQRFHKVITDEAWDLSTYPEFVALMRRAFKLGATYGVANWIVAHHKTNFDRSGNDSAIKDLITDSDTTICFAQDPKELELSADALGFTAAEQERIPHLPPGHAIHKIGSRTGIEVEHASLTRLRQVVETRHLLQRQNRR